MPLHVPREQIFMKVKKSCYWQGGSILGLVIVIQINTVIIIMITSTTSRRESNYKIRSGSSFRRKGSIDFSEEGHRHNGNH